MVAPPQAGRVKTVLVATDGSEYSIGAVRVALSMAAKAAARLLAMSVVISNDEYELVAAEAAAEDSRRARGLVDAVADKAAGAGVDCDTMVRRAQDPFEAIVAAAEEYGADVIVMGRRGRRGLARMMLGDATAKVICNTRSAVLVVPRAAAMWSRRLLLASDGSASSEAATDTALRLAGCCGVPATVLSVEVPKHAPARRAEARRIVERTVERLRAAGIQADGRVGQGDPPDVIMTAAGESGADLIVLGSHGRTGLGRLLVGSNSHAVIGRATCPVLVVKG